MKIVLSHPFSGALYAFFTEQDRGARLPEDMGHGYYGTLYGKRHSEVRDLALTNLLLYENVYMVAADNHMPETMKYYKGNNYHNDELGLYAEWSSEFLDHRELDEQVKVDLKDPVISGILDKVPKNSKRQILQDCRTEIALANKYSCPVLASGGRSLLIRRLSELDSTSNSVEHIKSLVVSATEEYIKIVGLSFNPTDYDLLYSYKRDKDLRDYATEFLSILNKIGSDENVRKQLLMLIRKSMGSQNLMKKTSSILDTSSIVLSLTGFIPGIGIFLSGGALAATGGSKLLEKESSRKWYEFGPQIRRITDSRLIERQIDKELNII